MKNSFKLPVAAALLVSGSLQAGTLVGNYSATCKDCVLRLDTKELVCGSCDDKNGNPVMEAKMDVSKVPMVDDVIGSLNANISNCDGKLVDAPMCSEPVNPPIVPLNKPMTPLNPPSK